MMEIMESSLVLLTPCFTGDWAVQATSLETIQVLALFSQRCAVRTARGIICTCNWIADHTIIMLVHKIT